MAAAVPPGPAGRIVITTARLRLREMTTADAAFMLELLNDPDFLRYIGDRGVRTLEDACRYIEKGTLDSYRRHGYGMYLAERLEDGAAVGVCGLVRREGLDGPDLGFALLPAWRGQGYATEGAAAVLVHARDLGLARVLAIATPDNRASNALLTSLGMRREATVRLPGDDADLWLYACATGG